MFQHIFTLEQARETLSWVREGMPVYDRNGVELGTVKDIQYSSDSSDILTKTLEFFRLPFEKQVQLMKNGYIQVDCGLIDHDCFATPEQISRFVGGGVTLNVDAEKLIRS